jgi:HTH-type transcriptional regulator/antitoxin HigA
MSLKSTPFETPGEFLESLLKRKGWSQRVLAVVLDMDETGVSCIVANERPIEPGLAVILEELVGVRTERFTDLQTRFDPARARIEERPDAERTRRAHLYRRLPVGEMIERRWINARDLRDDKVPSELMRSFRA